MSAEEQQEHARWLEFDRIVSDANGDTSWTRSGLRQTDINGVDTLVPASIWMSPDRFRIVNLPRGFDMPLHPAPALMLCVMMTGRLEITTSDGDARAFGPGEYYLATDFGASKGHRGRTIDGACTEILIELGDDVDLDQWTVSTPAS